MEYARIEMVLARGGWSRSAMFAGAVSGRVKGAVVDPARLVVTHTLVPAQVARQLAAAQPGADAAADAAATDGVTLTPKTIIQGETGSLGQMSRIWVDRATAKLTHVLFRAGGGLWGAKYEYVVAAQRIASLSSTRVALKPGMDALVALPLYRADVDIAADVRQALNGVLADPRARRAVKVLVEDGEVMLAGEVDTAEQAHLAEWAVTHVPGVREVTMDLVAQEELAAEVEARIAALGLPGQNGHAPVHVLSEHGIVYLDGTVPTAKHREQVEAVALAAAGARVVVNNVRVAGEPPDRAQGTGPLTRNR